MMASRAPAAPSRWPCSDLVALTGSRSARLAEDAAQGVDFDRIAFRRRRAVGVDVVDVGGGQPGVGQRRVEGAHLPGGGRAHQVAVVAGRAVAGQFTVDDGAAGDGVVPVFEHQRRPALAEHQPAALGGEGPAAVWGAGFVGVGQHAQGFPGAGDGVGLRRYRSRRPA